MKKNITICCLLALATVLGLGACSSDDVDQIPAGMGQVQVRLTARYNGATRATGDWLDPTDTKEKIHEYWVAFVNSSNVVEELVHGDALGAEEHTFLFILPPGNYTAYAFANLPEGTPETGESPAVPGTPFSSLGIVKGSAMPDLTNVKLATTNGWTKNIPMSSHTGGQPITVIEAENQSFEIELIRTMAKLELNFINNSQQQMDVLGYEIFPLTKTNVSLLEPANPESILKGDSISYKVEFPTGSPLVLPAKSTEVGAEPATQTTYLYVNETNATATSTKNQYSIRIFVQRHRVDNTTNPPSTIDVEEMRYGFTVNSKTQGDAWKTGETYGFDYIRRNDWIKLPIMFTDWTFRIEALPFPPIAGFQSRVLSADALSITFSSGGYIFLRPMFRNNHDPEGVWRGFDDGDVTFKLPGEPYIVNGTAAQEQVITDENVYGWTTPATGVAESIDPTTGTGVILTGDLAIFEQRFVQLPSGDIVGKLTNNKIKGMVTVTIKLQLEGFDYQFNYNIYEDNL
ncbi:MAG: FimB/Mfa2 family fimbrial subunit [Prevotella sp.]|nr:FimB/Mfa2 family fimbrial subunit [Prevotella sp.]